MVGLELDPVQAYPSLTSSCIWGGGEGEREGRRGERYIYIYIERERERERERENESLILYALSSLSYNNIRNI